MENSISSIQADNYSSGRRLNEHECFRLLWIKVILRAAYDWVLYRNSKSYSHKKDAEDAYRWIFDPPKEKRRVTINGQVKVILIQEFNSLENICDAINLDIDSVRSFARRLTRDQVKKLEFLERSSKIK